MKKVLSKINNAFKAMMPYMCLIAIVIGVVNISYIIKLQSGVNNVRSNVADVESRLKKIQRKLNIPISHDPWYPEEDAWDENDAEFNIR